MDKLSKIWIVLIFLTIFAFLLGWLKFISSTLLIILLITTFIKAHLVIEYFMSLRKVQLKYRLIPTIWLAVIILFIALGYYYPIN